jgi:hypothetical protein
MNQEIESALAGEQVVELVYDKVWRLVVPTALYEDRSGEVLLRAQQIEGPTSSGPLPRFRSLHLYKISQWAPLHTQFKVSQALLDDLEKLDLLRIIASVAPPPPIPLMVDKGAEEALQNA